MRGVTTGIDYIAGQSRIRAASKTPVVKGGEKGQELAKAARQPAEVKSLTMTHNGVLKTKFVLGLHPIDQSGQYVIP